MQLLTTLNLVTMGEYGEIGYYIKVSNSDEQSGNDRMRIKKEVKKEQRQPLFQFRYNERNGKFVREIRDPNEEKKTGKVQNWFENRNVIQSKFFALILSLGPGQS